jgi:predicted MPP superfamily phosphohydrolase
MIWKRYKMLFQRLGKHYVEKRLIRQTQYQPKLYQKNPDGMICSESLYPLYQLFFWSLIGLNRYDKGVKNNLQYTIEHVVARLEGLPTAFNRIKVLQISDLHIRSIPDQGDRLCKLLKNLECDLCVMTGDFHLGRFYLLDETVRITRKIIESIRAPLGIWGVLGNHDPIELVPELETMGCRMLVNESGIIHKNGSSFGLVGIDDSHYFKLHDLDTATQSLPSGLFRLLLSHSPDTYEIAAKTGIDYMVCGHTHGGQVRLGSGLPVYANARCPRPLVSGKWQYGGLKGYTSKGVGSSAVPVRFFCRPEITIHQLFSGKKCAV